jgi:hypothetical protein
MVVRRPLFLGVVEEVHAFKAASVYAHAQPGERRFDLFV